MTILTFNAVILYKGFHNGICAIPGELHVKVQGSGIICMADHINLERLWLITSPLNIFHWRSRVKAFARDFPVEILITLMHESFKNLVIERIILI